MTSGGQSLRTIRSWDGSQARAFEELCYQLRDPTPAGATLAKLGNPDAGYEWCVRFDSNGVEWGWQAKYSHDWETLRGLIEESLKTVVDKRPNCRQLTFCIPIDLPDARQGNERKSARQKFEDWKRSVRARIEGASRIRIELWQEGALLERLATPANRGRAWFFWDQEMFGPDWCRVRLEVTTKLAGERCDSIPSEASSSSVGATEGNEDAAGSYTESEAIGFDARLAPRMTSGESMRSPPTARGQRALAAEIAALRKLIARVDTE